jgi:hypothetical protein
VVTGAYNGSETVATAYGRNRIIFWNLMEIPFIVVIGINKQKYSP